MRRRIVVEYMFEGHCRGGGRGQGCVQRWELINRFASVDCWTACEAPGDDTLETTSQEGPVEELLNGAKCKRRRGVLSVSGDGRGRCGGRGGRWEEESRRNDEGPGPKSDGLAAICPASESHRIRVATNMSIASFGLPTPTLLSLTVSHSPVTLRPLSARSSSSNRPACTSLASHSGVSSERTAFQLTGGSTFYRFACHPTRSRHIVRSRQISLSQRTRPQLTIGKVT